MLAHTGKAVRAGRSFTRRLIDLAASVKKLDQFVRLNREARADVARWCQFAEEWNGTAMFLSTGTQNTEVVVTSDASGCREPWGSGHQWDGEVRTSYERNQVNTGKGGGGGG